MRLLTGDDEAARRARFRAPVRFVGPTRAGAGRSVFRDSPAHPRHGTREGDAKSARHGQGAAPSKRRTV
ncbi:hypothetical protein CG723_08105 [Streptomyces sp. CB01635]|nr:hypothetical protein CG723_08105 [Streptomyces sp. CB01635]